MNMISVLRALRDLDILRNRKSIHKTLVGVGMNAFRAAAMISQPESWNAQRGTAAGVHLNLDPVVCNGGATKCRRGIDVNIGVFGISKQ